MLLQHDTDRQFTAIQRSICGSRYRAALCESMVFNIECKISHLYDRTKRMIMSFLPEVIRKPTPTNASELIVIIKDSSRLCPSWCCIHQGKPYIIPAISYVWELETISGHQLTRPRPRPRLTKGYATSRQVVSEIRCYMNNIFRLVQS